MEQQQEVVQQQPQPPAPPATGPGAEGIQTQNAPQTDQKPASEVAPEKTEGDQHRSRQWRRLDRWRQRAIEAETWRKLREEQDRQAAPQQPAAQSQPADAAPVREQFQNYEEFIEARAAWRAEKAAAEKAQKVIEDAKNAEKAERTKGEQQKQAREWNTRLEAARDEIEDFDEVCAESEAPLTEPMSRTLLELDKGAHIAYYLAKNPQEAERISKLSPSRQAAALVALEDKVAKPVKPTTKAPDPINPVGHKAEVEKDISKMTDAEYSAYRKKRIAAKR